MGLMDRMMDRMIKNMSVEEKEEMMLKMMPTMMEGIDINKMMPDMMTTMGRLITITGIVVFIGKALNDAGYNHTAILSYAIKYASNFYGPFRDAGEGGMTFGDRKPYQMDFRRSQEWRDELEADLAQGANMVMVKPAAAYLDIIRRVKDTFAVPTFVYQVSGEYAMMKAAAANGWLDNDRIILESLLAFKRAGADAILTYAAPEAAALLKAGA